MVKLCYPWWPIQVETKINLPFIILEVTSVHIRKTIQKKYFVFKVCALKNRSMSTKHNNKIIIIYHIRNRYRSKIKNIVLEVFRYTISYQKIRVQTDQIIFALFVQFKKRMLKLTHVYTSYKKYSYHFYKISRIMQQNNRGCFPNSS